MKREEVIRMAREAGGLDFTTTNTGGMTVWLRTGKPEFLERFAKLVAAHEREACAKVCEEQAKALSDSKACGAEDCAAAIRARGEVPR